MSQIYLEGRVEGSGSASHMEEIKGVSVGKISHAHQIFTPQLSGKGEK